MSDYIPDLITSDFLRIPDISLVLDAHEMPFADGSLRAIVMTDVLHHLCSPRLFFNEATRCMERGGRIIMIEPWTTAWSSIVYSKLHHEPFDPETREWSFPSKGPLSGANGALPWILFSRDFALFRQEFPQWQLKTLKPMMPFSYLLAGGLSLRSLAPWIRICTNPPRKISWNRGSTNWQCSPTLCWSGSNHYRSCEDAVDLDRFG